jgi:selenocysteine-specific elongation factor
MVATHARPLAPGLARLVLDRPLPLHVGDRAVVRDPGSRALWGAVVVDPAPPPLRRRGDAARRATQLAGADGTVADELDRRRLVRRSVLRALGVPVAPLPAGTVEAGDWLLSPAYADRLRADLRALADRAGVDGAAGLAPAEAAHALGLPDPALVAALAAPGVRLDRGRVLSEGGRDLPPAAARALDALRAELDGDPFAAPPADRLAELGLDPETVAVLHRAGRVLRLAPGVVLLAGTEQEAAARLRKLDPPFTASEARRAWGTSRRIALPLLAHLDAAGVTVRLADDTRRLRRG